MPGIAASRSTRGIRDAFAMVGAFLFSTSLWACR
jgi:hypothetical protein